MSGEVVVLSEVGGCLSERSGCGGGVVVGMIWMCSVEF